MTPCPRLGTTWARSTRKPWQEMRRKRRWMRRRKQRNWRRIPWEKGFWGPPDDWRGKKARWKKNNFGNNETDFYKYRRFGALYFFILSFSCLPILSTIFIDFPYPCHTNNVTKTSLETHPQLPPFGWPPGRGHSQWVTTLGGRQLAVDTTLVSPFTREGRPRRRNGRYAGAALQDARRNKERVYRELVASGRCRLMVLASEIGGRWSQETCTFLRLLASHRARQTPQILQQAVSTALLHRWSAMLTHAAAATAYAASLQGSDGASETNVEGTPPSFSELLAQTPPEHPPASRFPPPATWQDFATWGTDQVKNCQPWTCSTPGDRPDEKLFSLTELLQQKGAEKTQFNQTHWAPMS